MSIESNLAPEFHFLADIGDDRESLLGDPDHAATSTNSAHVTNPTAFLNPSQQIECTGWVTPNAARSLRTVTNGFAIKSSTTSEALLRDARARR